MGRTPHALNLAIAAARHDILVRVDGHGELGDRYIARAVELLAETGAANVGGVMEARGRTPFEQAVAFVYTSRYGLGGAAFHQGDVPAGPADTVFLGVFDKAEVQAVGGFDETMFRAQDWELNYRLRQSGRLVWFSPELRVTYRPRSTLKALIKQMYDTGKWRREVVRRHPDTASVRYLAPPAAVVAIGVGTLGALARSRHRLPLPAAGRAGPGRLRGLRRVRDGHGAGDPAAGGASLAARRAGRHPPGLGEWVPGRPPLTGSSEPVCGVSVCAGRGCLLSNFPSVDGFCGDVWVAVRWNFPSVDGMCGSRSGAADVANLRQLTESSGRR